jgi:AraC-like DNA-binding protein
MTDPLSQVIALLRPRAVFTKGISGAGRWAVRYSPFGLPSFCAVLEGRCRLTVDGTDPVTLEAGDFVLLPETPGFTMAGFEPTRPKLLDPNEAQDDADEVRHGDPHGPPDVRLLGGYFLFDSPDPELLASLVPPIVHMRDALRLAAIVQMVRDEALAGRAGRDLVLSRLVEVLLVEALRYAQHDGAPPGLLRGLADPRLAGALRALHRDIARPWTVAQLAGEASLSRSAFFDRFTRVVGMPPKEYLLGWRMAVAKDLLRAGQAPLAEIAERVGYSSGTTFSTAFRRQIGQPPSHYARTVRVRAA